MHQKSSHPNILIVSRMDHTHTILPWILAKDLLMKTLSKWHSGYVASEKKYYIRFGSSFMTWDMPPRHIHPSEFGKRISSILAQKCSEKTFRKVFFKGICRKFCRFVLIAKDVDCHLHVFARFLQCIGKGTFGRVYLVRKRDDAAQRHDFAGGEWYGGTAVRKGLLFSGEWCLLVDDDFIVVKRLNFVRGCLP